MKPSEDKERLVSAVEEAEEAFWRVVADAFPEATSGDFPPDATVELDAALLKAAKLWVEWNADPEYPDTLTTEIMLHRIEYYYRGFDDVRLHDTDEEHIAYCISQGISEGELCTHVGAGQEAYGWWKINNCPE